MYHCEWAAFIKRAENGFVVEGPRTGDAPPKQWAFESAAALAAHIFHWAGGTNEGWPRIEVEGTPVEVDPSSAHARVSALISGTVHAIRSLIPDPKDRAAALQAVSQLEYQLRYAADRIDFPKAL